MRAKLVGCKDCRFYVDWEWPSNKCRVGKTKKFSPLIGKMVLDPQSCKDCMKKNFDGACVDFQEVSFLRKIWNRLSV